MTTSTVSAEALASYAEKHTTAMAGLLVAYLSGDATADVTATAIEQMEKPTFGTPAPKPKIGDPGYADWYEDLPYGPSASGDYADLNEAFMLRLITDADFDLFQRAYVS